MALLSIATLICVSVILGAFSSVAGEEETTKDREFVANVQTENANEHG